MKFLKLIFIIVFFFVVGYVLGNIFPFNSLFLFRGIAREVDLKITVLRDDQTAVSGVEVDIDESLPPLPIRMVSSLTNESGVATFKLKPGTYFVFFNLNNFPQDLEFPKTSQRIDIQGNRENELTIVLKRK